MIDLCVKVVFEGVRGKGYHGDIALDDIVIKDGFCPPLKECAFEDINMCGWTNEKRYLITHCMWQAVLQTLDTMLHHTFRLVYNVHWSIFRKLEVVELS